MRSLLLLPLVVLLFTACETALVVPQTGPLYVTDLGIRETVWGSLQTYEGLRPITQAPPILPMRVGNLRGQGATQGALLIAPDGTVTEANLHQSSGSEDLDKAALRAFRKWTFPVTESTVQRVSINTISFNINTKHSPISAPQVFHP